MEGRRCHRWTGNPLLITNFITTIVLEQFEQPEHDMFRAENTNLFQFAGMYIYGELLISIKTRN
jgi:hypothetical protein